jgi:hypothetical protein
MRRGYRNRISVIAASLLLAGSAVSASSEDLLGTEVTLLAGWTAASAEVVGVLDHDGDGFPDLALQLDRAGGSGLWVVYGASCVAGGAASRCTAKRFDVETAREPWGFADVNEDGFDDVFVQRDAGRVMLAQSRRPVPIIEVLTP